MSARPEQEICLQCENVNRRLDSDDRNLTYVTVQPAPAPAFETRCIDGRGDAKQNKQKWLFHLSSCLAVIALKILPVKIHKMTFWVVCESSRNSLVWRSADHCWAQRREAGGFFKMLVMLLFHFHELYEIPPESASSMKHATSLLDFCDGEFHNSNKIKLSKSAVSRGAHFIWWDLLPLLVLKIIWWINKGISSVPMFHSDLLQKSQKVSCGDFLWMFCTQTAVRLCVVTCRHYLSHWAPFPSLRHSSHA